MNTYLEKAEDMILCNEVYFKCWAGNKIVAQLQFHTAFDKLDFEFGEVDGVLAFHAV